jgi:hypothetical protein
MNTAAQADENQGPDFTIEIPVNSFPPLDAP